MLKKSVATFFIIAIIVISGIAVLQLTGQDNDRSSGQLAVTATYYPLYDFATQVGGDRIDAVNVTPAGIEPHDFDPSPQALIQAHSSDVFIYNSESMEPWVDSFLKDYTNTAVRVSEGIELRANDHHHDHAENDDQDENNSGSRGSGAIDPHFWLDPVLAQQMVATIRDGLIKADPENVQYYTNNAEQYKQKLATLDQRFTEGLSDCKLDTVISSHAAFSYLARRYDFRVVSIAGIEPSDEPTPAKMAEITDLVRREGIKYIFFESLVSPRLSETIANETGAKTLVFDPIEGVSQTEQDKGKDYISVQYDNLANLKKALECS